MALFPFTKDLQAFLLRVTASLDGLDNAIRDAQRLIRNADEGITELRQTVEGLRNGLGQPQKRQD